VPCRDGDQLIFDSAASALGNSPVFKADDRGVLDVRRLRITQKTGEFTGLRRIAPCTPTLIKSYILIKKIIRKDESYSAITKGRRDMPCKHRKGT
jgi:hypothetical protein